jgi:hypothetical protein
MPDCGLRGLHPRRLDHGDRPRNTRSILATATIKKKEIAKNYRVFTNMPHSITERRISRPVMLSCSTGYIIIVNYEKDGISQHPAVKQPKQQLYGH